MRPLARVFRCARNSGLPILLLAGTFMLETTSGFASEAKSESIQATYSQAGNAIAVTLIIYNYLSLIHI